MYFYIDLVKCTFTASLCIVAGKDMSRYALSASKCQPKENHTQPQLYSTGQLWEELQ